MDGLKNNRKSERMRKKITVSVLSIVGLGILYVAFLQLKIYQHSHQEIPKNVDYLIVLGARVKGTVPSLSLQYRIDAAAAYLLENKKTIAIVSGGQGEGEDISEAEAMRRELVRKGVEESRIILEDGSTSTYENITFSKKLIPSGSRTGLIVSNDFHLYRASMIAEREELQVTGIPAKTPEIVLVKSYVREYLAITKYFITRI